MNVSVSELLVVLLVALLVIKPDQLPEVAHALGKFTRMMRAMFAKIKNEMADVSKTVENQHEQS